METNLWQWEKKNSPKTYWKSFIRSFEPLSGNFLFLRTFQNFPPLDEKYIFLTKNFIRLNLLQNNFFVDSNNFRGKKFLTRTFQNVRFGPLTEKKKFFEKKNIYSRKKFFSKLLRKTRKLFSSHFGQKKLFLPTAKCLALRPTA